MPSSLTVDLEALNRPQPTGLPGAAWKQFRTFKGVGPTIDIQAVKTGKVVEGQVNG